MRAGWEPARDVPAWIDALQPATTGLLGQDGYKLWVAGDRAALGIRAGGVVYPIFPQAPHPDWEPGARAVLELVGDSWCIMGPAAWVLAAEPMMPVSLIQHRVEYEFLVRPAIESAVPEGRGLLRRAESSDANALFPLQEGYEKEEVLFVADDFQPIVSRLHLGKSLKTQEIAALWEERKPIAKAGTNAVTPTWAQIGGVYTRPEFRGQGCQKRLMTFLLNRLASQGRSACLFVKKKNQAAIALYQGLGFTKSGDFLITYGLRL